MYKPDFIEHLQEINLAEHLDQIPLGAIGFNRKGEITHWSKTAAVIFEWDE